MNAPFAAATSALSAALPGQVATDPAACLAASYDSTRLSFLPEAVVRPADEDAIGTLLKLANLHRVPVTARGAGSATTGATAPVRGGWVVDLTGWTQLQIDAETGFAYVQPGVTVATLQAAAEAQGWLYPPDPSSAKYATVGGTLATNAGGLRAAKYGVTRDYVLALEGFLPTGEWVRWGADVRKFASGYNLRDLWLGSEGTLGLITGAVLRLVPQPASRWTALIAYADEASAVAAVRSLLAQRIVPAVLEFLDRQTTLCTERYHGAPVMPEAGSGDTSPALLLLELDGHAAAVAEDQARVLEWICTSGALAFREANGEAGEALWHVRRTCSQAMFALGPDKLNEDIVVPLRAQAELLDLTLRLKAETGLPTPTFGHAADGNFHVHFMYDRRDPDQLARAEAGVEKLMREVIRLGGAITGEHGVGLAKSTFFPWQHSPAEIAAMRAIKAALDPNGVLNPGKIFEPFRTWAETPLDVRLPWDKRPPRG